VSEDVAYNATLHFANEELHPQFVFSSKKLKCSVMYSAGIVATAHKFKVGTSTDTLELANATFQVFKERSWSSREARSWLSMSMSLSRFCLDVWIRGTIKNVIHVSNKPKTPSVPKISIDA
jgi:hypothetical protein